MLASLADDANGSVRDSVSCNESAPIAALERLARDELHTVRESVAVHDAAPDSLLRSLAESDPHEHVRKLAALALRARSQ